MAERRDGRTDGRMSERLEGKFANMSRRRMMKREAVNDCFIAMIIRLEIRMIQIYLDLGANMKKKKYIIVS